MEGRGPSLMMTRKLAISYLPETAVPAGVDLIFILWQYLQLVSEFHLKMFDDRTKIYSPGGMLPGRKAPD